MSVSELIRQRVTSAGVLSPQQLVAQYQRLRSVSRNLHSTLARTLSKDALHEGARKLGLLQGDTLVFGSEDETAVLMDYCLYHVRRNGRNAVEQFCHDHPPAPGTDEAACLHAMQSAIHSMFRVDAVEPGVGLAVTDLAREEQHLLVDIGLSQTAKPGLLLLTRLLLFADFAATAGASLAVGQLPPEETAKFSAEWKQVSTSRNADYDPGPLIHDALHRDVMRHTRYLDPSSSPVRRPQMLNVPRQRSAALLKLAGKADPTRRCPCGSGKMFKNCCLKNPK